MDEDDRLRWSEGMFCCLTDWHHSLNLRQSLRDPLQYESWTTSVNEYLLVNSEDLVHKKSKNRMQSFVSDTLQTMLLLFFVGLNILLF